MRNPGLFWTFHREGFHLIEMIFTFSNLPLKEYYPLKGWYEKATLKRLKAVLSRTVNAKPILFFLSLFKWLIITYVAPIQCLTFNSLKNQNNANYWFSDTKLMIWKKLDLFLGKEHFYDANIHDKTRNSTLTNNTKNVPCQFV